MCIHDLFYNYFGINSPIREKHLTYENKATFKMLIPKNTSQDSSVEWNGPFY
jgi:hypothetical protein